MHGSFTGGVGPNKISFTPGRNIPWQGIILEGLREFWDKQESDPHTKSPNLDASSKGDLYMVHYHPVVAHGAGAPGATLPT